MCRMVRPSDLGATSKRTKGSDLPIFYNRRSIYVCTSPNAHSSAHLHIASDSNVSRHRRTQTDLSAFEVSITKPNFQGSMAHNIPHAVPTSTIHTAIIQHSLPKPSHLVATAGPHAPFARTPVLPQSDRASPFEVHAMYAVYRFYASPFRCPPQSGRHHTEPPGHHPPKQAAGTAPNPAPDMRRNTRYALHSSRAGTLLEDTEARGDPLRPLR